MIDPVRSFFEHFDAYDVSVAEQRLLLFISDGILMLTLLSLVFALLAIMLRVQNMRHERRWQRLHEKWDTPLLDVLCGAGSSDEFLKLVGKGEELDFVRFLAPYGYRLRGSDLDILATLARHFLPFVIRRLQHSSPGVRVWAINVIDLFGMPACEKEVALRLDDSSPVVAMFAASTLMGHQRIQYIDKVIDQLSRFGNWNVNALASLLVRAGPAATGLIETVYIDRSRPLRTRIIAARALGNSNAYTALDSALLMLGSENDQDLLVATLHLLGRISQGRQIDSVRALCRSSNDVLRTNAMNTLRQLAIADDKPLFIKALQDPNPWVARQAAFALRDLGEIGTLQQIAADPDHPQTTLARYVLAGRG